MSRKDLSPLALRNAGNPFHSSQIAANSTVNSQPARDKIARVFRYLEALNQHRNPVQWNIDSQLWRLWLHDLPVHSSIEMGPARGNAPGGAIPEDFSQGTEANFIFKVRRPKLTSPPEPPPEIVPWLKDAWDDPGTDEVIRDARKVSHHPGEAETLSASLEKGSSFREWQKRRDEWAEGERPAREAMKIFEMLYELHGQLEREAERVEMVLGDGILHWHRAEGTIHHPILLQRLQLEFDPAIPEFTVSEAEQPVELYSALFQSLGEVDGRAVGRCREELDQGGYHPLGGEPTSSFLKRLVVQLSPRGQFMESGLAQEERTGPWIERDPVVFLRARTLGFAAAIEGILDDLRTRQELPWALLNIVGEEAPIVEGDPAGQHPASSFDEPQPDVLLSKPANPEQVRIALQLEQHGGVLVQGPPGTGKTHTIGNLIGHLLAQGKSVLVTSHTTKALRMVRQHIDPALRPLCVSLLDSDLDSRRQLESAVAGIAERLSSADSASLDREACALEAERHELVQTLNSILHQLAQARADEYREIVIGDRSWIPADAARKVRQDEDRHGWIPGPVTAEAALPLSNAELAELYRTNVSLSPEDEHELSGDLYDLKLLPKPEKFEALVNERNRLRLDNTDLRCELWNPGQVRGSESQIEELTAKLVQAVDPLSGREKWKLAAVYAGKYGGVHVQPWKELVALVRFVHRCAADSQEAFLQHGPVLPGNASPEENLRIADEILEHLEMGRKLSPLVLLKHPDWRSFLATARVNGARPRLARQFEALRKLAQLKIVRHELGLRWDRQLAVLGALPSSEMGDALENTVIQFCGPIEDCLAWRERIWDPLEQELKALGFHWEKFLSEQPVCAGAFGELARIERAVAIALLPILTARFQKLRLFRITHELQELRDRIERARQEFISSRILSQLAEAANRLDPAAFAEAHRRLTDLVSRQEDFDARRCLLERLERSAPAWAAAIRLRQGIHAGREIPGDPEQAWQWRQLTEELERRSSVSLEALQSRGEKLREQLRRTTVDLIDRRAWAFQARRTSPQQKQALIGWLDTIRRIGKGTGLRVPLLRVEAARKMSECRAAVPVWVMPLSRVAENFDPRVTRFDVVIVDEASQSDVMALIALYMSKSVLVVGDHEQVSPTPVGQDLALVGNLISQYLHGIPNSHLYDGQISIYDLARQSFGGTTCLVEHFRCVPEIIQFSNVVSYDSRVKPLRDASRVQIRPPLVSYRVDGSCREDKLNRQEALAITSLIAAAIEQPEYQVSEAGRPVSFGVVSLVGDEQAIVIDSLLRRHLSPERYELHRLLCGNAAQFQGDERDVVFISLVDTAESGPLNLRDQQLFKQRFNVAASRARDQMWIVHSLSPELDLKAGDLRRQLIEHADASGRWISDLMDGKKDVRSPFEREIMGCLDARGYRASPHWRVGKYTLDLVVEGDGKRLAIECHGDPHYPVDVERLPEDIERQAILERLGWVFTHVRASEFLRDSDRAMQPVFEKLQALEIVPAGPGCQTRSDQPAPESQGVASQQDPKPDFVAPEDIVARVTRRADELRREWADDVAQHELPHRRLAFGSRKKSERLRAGCGASKRW
jgi:very-short-patch-repair endonuclease